MKGHPVYLVHLMELAGDTQVSLARAVGAWPSAIARLCRKRGAGCQHGMHLLICRHYGVDPYDMRYGPPTVAERRAHERRMADRRKRQRREWHTEIAEAVS